MRAELQKAVQSISELEETPEGRKWLVQNYGYFMFCHVYLKHHFPLPWGRVHHDIRRALESGEKFITFTSFRGCGKTTEVTLGYSLYCICEQLEPFILIISDTGPQSRIMVSNIKEELENNELLRDDYGDLQTKIWGETQIRTTTGIQVVAKSKGKKVRGLKYRNHRPTLTLVDDPQTYEDVRTKERRDKDYRWLFNEVVPARDKERGRIFVIGNLLHKDALIPRLSHKTNWVSYAAAITEDGTEDGAPMWAAMYPNKKSIQEEKENNDPITWQREFMLKIVPEEGMIISDVHYYTEVPHGAEFLYSALGLDLAISRKETADYTAFVKGDVYIYQERPLIAITHAHQARMGMRETIEYAKTISQHADGSYAYMFVEDVAYQKACIEEMENELLPVYGITTEGKDKRARLHVVSPLIQKGQVLFPESGCEDLIMQLLGFGIEAHDDLVDALTTMLRGVQKIGLQTGDITWI